jgi:beta-phosphoglucomutase-like phosphatase (HAD superfamily)
MAAMSLGDGAQSQVERVWGMLVSANYFDTIVSGLDVARVKPAPDIFLEAANRLGVDPGECAVLEDAEKGVLAAHAAGMRCVAVPNEYTRDHDFSKATHVCSSLNEVTVKLLQDIGINT